MTSGDSKDIPVDRWFEGVRSTRERLGMNQKEFAAAIGVKSQGYVSELEKGRVKPSLDVFQKIDALMKRAVGESVPRVEGIPPGSKAAAADTEHPAIRKLIEACRPLTVREVDLICSLAERFLEVRRNAQQGIRMPSVQDAMNAKRKGSQR